MKQTKRRLGGTANPSDFFRPRTKSSSSFGNLRSISTDNNTMLNVHKATQSDWVSYSSNGFSENENVDKMSLDSLKSISTDNDIITNVQAMKSDWVSFSTNGFGDDKNPNILFTDIKGINDFAGKNHFEAIDLTQPDSEINRSSVSSARTLTVGSKNDARDRDISVTNIETTGDDTITATRTPSLPKKRKVPAWDSVIHNRKSATRAKLSTTKKSGHTPSNEPKELSEEQLQVLKIAKEGKNLFFTGAAGTGKSFLLQKIIYSLRVLHGESSVAVTATTGLAGLNIQGSTLHKWAGIGLGDSPASDLITRISRNRANTAKWQTTRALIIDEISMLDGALFEKLDQIGRQIRKIQKPFGGIQLILTGDFYQLPPVTKRSNGGGQVQFCFQTKTWGEAITHQVELTTIFRQKGDQTLIDMLSALREAKLTRDIITKFQDLSREIKYEDGISPTELYPTKVQVNQANNRQLNQLKGKLFKFISTDYVKEEFFKKLLENIMVEETLELKLNSQVLLVKNDPDSGLVNGSQGRVISFVSDEAMWNKLSRDKTALDIYTKLIESCPSDGDLGISIQRYLSDAKDINESSFGLLQQLVPICEGNYPLLSPVVEFVDKSMGKIVKVIFRNEFSHSSPPPKEQLLVSRRQFPLVLSWALSIHKAQGQTLQRVKVNLARSFESGQAYVAISRATSTAGLQIEGFSERVVKINPAVRDFYRSLKE